MFEEGKITSKYEDLPFGERVTKIYADETAGTVDYTTGHIKVNAIQI